MHTLVSPVMEKLYTDSNNHLFEVKNNLGGPIEYSVDGWFKLYSHIPSNTWYNMIRISTLEEYGNADYIGDRTVSIKMNYLYYILTGSYGFDYNGPVDPNLYNFISVNWADLG